MLARVSQQVVDAVYSRLSSVTNGYNVGIATQAATYGLPASSMQLNFAAGSQNFYFDNVDTESLEKSGIVAYPCACLYVLDSVQTNDQKFAQFSGAIRCVFEVNLSWTSIKGMQGRESYSSCVEDVVFDVINRLDNQNWGKPLVYNGQIQCRRGPSVFGAQNWKKKLTFVVLFQVHQ